MKSAVQIYKLPARAPNETLDVTLPDVVSDYAYDFNACSVLPTPDSKEWIEKDLRLKPDNRNSKNMVECTDKIAPK